MKKTVGLIFLLFYLNAQNLQYKPYLQSVYKVSTLGLGGDLAVAFNPAFVSRVTYNVFSLHRHINYDGKKFYLKALMQNSGLLFDVHPWQNAFFFSWGAYYCKDDIKVFYKPKSNKIVVGDHTYPAREIGNVTTTINLKRRINPYFGIGFNSVDYNNKWHFTFDIGAIYTGAAKAKVSAVAAKGFEGIQDILDSEAKIEEKKINAKLKRYKFYPVVSVGIAVKF